MIFKVLCQQNCLLKLTPSVWYDTNLGGATFAGVRISNKISTNSQSLFAMQTRPQLASMSPTCRQRVVGVSWTVRSFVFLLTCWPFIGFNPPAIQVTRIGFNWLYFLSSVPYNGNVINDILFIVRHGLRVKMWILHRIRMVVEPFFFLFLH